MTCCATGMEGQAFIVCERSGRVHVLHLVLRDGVSAHVLLTGEPVIESPKTLNDESLLGRFKDGVEQSRKANGDCHRETLRWHNMLTVAMENAADYQHAEMLYRQALEGWARIADLQDRDVLICFNNLQFLLQEQGRAKEGNELASELPRMFQRRNLERLANAEPEKRRRAAVELFKEGDYETAEKIWQQLVDSGHDVAINCSHLARLSVLTDRGLEARNVVRQSVCQLTLWHFCSGSIFCSRWKKVRRCPFRAPRLNSVISRPCCNTKRLRPNGRWLPC